MVTRDHSVASGGGVCNNDAIVYCFAILVGPDGNEPCIHADDLTGDMEDESKEPDTYEEESDQELAQERSWRNTKGCMVI